MRLLKSGDVRSIDNQSLISWRASVDGSHDSLVTGLERPCMEMSSIET
jgi:hypothetical protein